MEHLGGSGPLNVVSDCSELYIFYLLSKSADYSVKWHERSWRALIGIRGLVFTRLGSQQHGGCGGKQGHPRNLAFENHMHFMQERCFLALLGWKPSV